MAKKPESSRLNVLYIIQVLKNYSDEENPLSVKEIGEYVNRKYGHMSAADKFMSQDTIKRTLDELTCELFPTGAFDIEYENEFEYGYKIVCVMKHGNKFVPYEFNEKKNPKKYYYYRSNFSIAEIRTLVDAMETHNYFSEEDVVMIINKLMRHQPRSFFKARHSEIEKNIREEDSLLLMNIDLLNTIISHKNCAQITYCNYDYEKKLVPRPGYPRKVEPVSMMWSNGFYYMLAYIPKYDNVISYRVDRILDIEEIDEKLTRQDIVINPVKYRFEHPVMFGGKKADITLLCRDTGKNYIMNTIMDVFGKFAKISLASDEFLQSYLGKDTRYYKEQGVTWLKVSVTASIAGVELWAAQYCNDCIIISPKEMAEAVKEKMLQGIQYYEQ